jgi:ubiquinone/menaquinone biosynthesis C-methylase UbiE
MNIKKQYNSIGVKYVSGQKSYHEKKGLDGSFRFIIQYLNNLTNQTVLDVGCGGGLGIIEFQKLGAKSIYGIDSSEVMVGETKKVVADPKLISVQDIESTNFSDDMFDVVICRLSLHYLDQLDKSWSEISRILKVGGRLVVVVNHPLKDLFKQEKLIYGNKEVNTFEVHEDKVRLSFPSHTLSDYFTEIFFTHFDLRNIYESKKQKNNERFIPDNFGFCAIKR